VQVITAADAGWVGPFTGLPPPAFRRLVAQVERRGGRVVADGVRGRQWSLPLADRVLLVAAYYRTNLTMRRLAPLFGSRPRRCIGSSTGSAGSWRWRQVVGGTGRTPC